MQKAAWLESEAKWLAWNKKSLQSAEAYRRLLTFQPGNEEARFDLAQVEASQDLSLLSAVLANGWVSKWRSFESIFAEPFQELRRIANGKPMAVFETGSAPEVGNKEEWILEALETARALQLAGVVWFEVNKEIVPLE